MTGDAERRRRNDLMAACRLCRRQEPTLAEILLLLPFPTRIGGSTAGRTGPPAEVVGSRDEVRPLPRRNPAPRRAARRRSRSGLRARGLVPAPQASRAS